MVSNPFFGTGFGAQSTDREDYPVMLGRDIYTSRSMTGQNRAPIQDLISYTISGIENMDFRPDAETVCESLLVDGSFVLLYPESAGVDAEPEFMADTYVPEPGKIIRYLRNKSGVLELHAPLGNLDKVYSPKWVEMTLEGGSWVQRLWHMRADGPEELEPDDGELAAIPAEQIYAHPGGRGILYWAQDVYHRLQENKLIQTDVLSGVNLLPIAIGEFGDPESIRQAVNTARRILVLTGDGTIDRSVANSVAGFLGNESDQLRADWYDSLNVVEQTQSERPVASDRSIRMRTMQRFVMRKRKELERVFSDWGILLNFDKLVIDTADERLKELELLNLIRPVIGEDEFITRVKML